MCEEESEDHEAVAKLFEINDSIHRTIERYKLFKKGDIEGANKIPQGTLGKSGAGVSKGPDDSLNLIDFGDPEPAPAAREPPSGSTAQPAQKGNALEDDLLGLSLGGPSFGQTGGISLGGPSIGSSNGSGKYPSLRNSTCAKFRLVLGLSGMAVPKSPQQQQAAVQSINDLFGAAPKSGPPSQVPSPPPSAFSQPPPQPARSTPDPFAALASPAPRQASPMHFQHSIRSPTPSSGVADLLGGIAPAPSSNLAQSSASATNDDDEWTFASAVPDTTMEVTVTNTSINVVFTVSRESDTVLLIKSRVSNNTPLPVSNLTFQVAASRVSSSPCRLFSKHSLTLRRAHSYN